MPFSQHPSRNDGSRAEVSVRDGRVLCHGGWTVHGVGGLHGRLSKLEWPKGAEIAADCGGIAAFDTAGAWLLVEMVNSRKVAGQTLLLENLRSEHQVLLHLVQSRAAVTTLPAMPKPIGPLARVGARAWRSVDEVRGALAFLGESMSTFLHALRHPRHWRGRAILHNIQHAGFDALPIVGLLSFLIGTVIAYQAATQLERYGANIFIADLVGHSILRELAPMLVAIIVAGRSGSAYAAEIGTMKVSEEIDALRTMGLSPFAMLVVPKIVALAIVLPLLTVFADVMGVLGGFLVAKLQLEVDAYSFLDRFDDTIQLSTFLFGVGKAPVFGVIVAVVGCYQGFRASGSADSVGRHTTISVVQAIFLVILADAVFSVLASATRLGFR